MNYESIIKELRSDLFYQIAAKHGPEKASKYPSILKADEALKQVENLNIACVSTITIEECWWCSKKFNNTEMLTVHSSEFKEGSHQICPCCNEKFNLA